MDGAAILPPEEHTSLESSPDPPWCGRGERGARLADLLHLSLFWRENAPCLVAGTVVPLLFSPQAPGSAQQSSSTPWASTCKTPLLLIFKRRDYFDASAIAPSSLQPPPQLAEPWLRSLEQKVRHRSKVCHLFIF